jgi:hypothetical protein
VLFAVLRATLRAGGFFAVDFNAGFLVDMVSPSIGARGAMDPRVERPRVSLTIT